MVALDVSQGADVLIAQWVGSWLWVAACSHRLAAPLSGVSPRLGALGLQPPGPPVLPGSQPWPAARELPVP